MPFRLRFPRLRSPAPIGVILALSGSALLVMPSPSRAQAQGKSTQTTNTQGTYANVYECVFRGHFSKKACIDAFDDAWDVYRERAPRFKTRPECNARYKVCVVFNPPSYGGRPPPPITPAQVTYAPPLLSVVLSASGDALQVLIDTSRKPLVGGVPQRNAAKPAIGKPGFSGTNFAPPPGTFVPRQRNIEGRYADTPDEAGLSAGAPQIDAPGEISLDGVSSYPVPESRRRKRTTP